MHQSNLGSEAVIDGGAAGNDTPNSFSKRSRISKTEEPWYRNPADFGSAAYSCQSSWYLGLRRRNSHAQIRPIAFFGSGYCVKSCQLGSQSGLSIKFLFL